MLTIQVTTEIKPIAASLREETEELFAIVKGVRGGFSELLDVMRRIGANLVESETLIKGKMPFDEWLRANVPLLPLALALKCKKVSERGIDNPRQLIWNVILGEPEKKPREPKLDPPIYCKVFDLLNSFEDYAEKSPIRTWPAEQFDHLRRRLEPVARQLWPERF